MARAKQIAKDSLYLLHPMTDDPFRPQEAWLRDYLGKHEKKCGHLDLGRAIRSITISYKGEDVALGFVHRVLGDVIRDDLYEALQPEAKKYLSLGVLRNADKSVLAGYRTYWN